MENANPLASLQTCWLRNPEVSTSPQGMLTHAHQLNRGSTPHQRPPQACFSVCLHNAHSSTAGSALCRLLPRDRSLQRPGEIFHVPCPPRGVNPQAPDGHPAQTPPDLLGRGPLSWFTPLASVGRTTGLFSVRPGFPRYGGSRITDNLCCSGAPDGARKVPLAERRADALGGGELRGKQA